MLPLNDLGAAYHNSLEKDIAWFFPVSADPLFLRVRDWVRGPAILIGTAPFTAFGYLLPHEEETDPGRLKLGETTKG